MSHTTTIELEIKDQASFTQACKDLGFEVTENTNVKLYQKDSNFENVTAVKLPGWNYPVVVQDGQVHYDNFNGRWGKNEHLDNLRQRYARNVAVKQAKSKGYHITEKKEDGKVKLVLTR